MKTAVLVSGGGTNLQALIDAQSRGELGSAEIVCVISSKPGVFALERAAKANIPTAVVDRSTFDSSEAFDKAILEQLENFGAELVVLAGFMRILGDTVLSKFPRRIINVHPSLIPSFCGDGFYGLRVHRAALDYGVKVTGATVFYVNEITDGGEIIVQKAVDVMDGDTPETLQRRVMEQAEWIILPKAVKLIAEENDKL
ncbi:MAG: phosphoribosylglycinamide formyltransferase [Oscillospiraceae bacterium]|nr:phosphoribosylglycinamide formyltransferase [Oscillospiraceae bacterium]MBQ3049952.1 phosphoribosylglycinamide formyltransferase [Oscillospiraceae bacterium]